MRRIGRKPFLHLMTSDMTRKKGYRMYKVLEFINNSDTGVTYTDIIRYAFQISGGSYHHTNHRGYYSCHFVCEGIDNYGYPKKVGYMSLYATKQNGKYILNQKGKDKLQELTIKFKLR